jgi:hypothetical protein
VIVHRRIKRIRTALGFKVVQDMNAYHHSGARGAGRQHLAPAARLIATATSCNVAVDCQNSYPYLCCSCTARQPQIDRQGGTAGGGMVPPHGGLYCFQIRQRRIPSSCNGILIENFVAIDNVSDGICYADVVEKIALEYPIVRREISNDAASR